VLVNFYHETVVRECFHCIHDQGVYHLVVQY